MCVLSYPLSSFMAHRDGSFLWYHTCEAGRPLLTSCIHQFVSVLLLKAPKHCTSPVCQAAPVQTHPLTHVHTLPEYPIFPVDHQSLSPYTQRLQCQTCVSSDDNAPNFRANNPSEDPPPTPPPHTHTHTHTSPQRANTSVLAHC